MVKQKTGTLLLATGLDVSNPAEYIGEQSSPDNENFHIHSGVLAKRNGTVAFGTTASEEIMRGVEFNREGTKYNIRVGLTKLEKYSSGWASIKGAATWSGSTDDPVDFAIPLLSGKRILCMTNGIDAMLKWTGTGNVSTLGGSPPIPKFILEYKTYLVCGNIAGGTDVTQRIQWSDTADPENWSTGNSGSLDLIEDGRDITGLAPFGNYMAVHKDSAIYLGYLVSTTDIFKFDRKNTGSGTIANATIVNLPTGVQAFLASDGIRSFNGITTQLIDTKVNDEIRQFLNTEQAHKSWAVLVKEEDEVWFGIPIGNQTTGDTIYKFNYKTGVIYKDSRDNISAVWRATQTTSLSWNNTPGTWDASTDRWNNSSLLSSFPQINISDNTGLTTVVDSTVNNDNDVAIPAFWESKDFEPETKGHLARWVGVEIWARGNTLKVEYSTDGGDNWTETSESPYTLTDAFPTDIAPLISYFDVMSSRIRLRLSNSVSEETVQIKQFILRYKQREARR